MAISGEVFAWPEATLYVYPSGTASAAMAYCENVTVQAQYNWLKFKSQGTGSFAARTTFVLADKDATVGIGAMFYDNTLFGNINSATAYNCDLVMSAGGGNPNSAAFRVWSAVFTQFGLQGQHGDVFRAQIGMRAADISALY